MNGALKGEEEKSVSFRTEEKGRISELSAARLVGGPPFIAATQTSTRYPYHFIQKDCEVCQSIRTAPSGFV